MPKRNRVKREQDLTEIARRYCQGETQWQIALSLGVNQSTISDDLRILQKRWQAAGLRDLDEHKGKELAKIDHLELVYWDAWENSKKDKSKSKTEKRGVGNAISTLAGIEKQTRDGEPRFLEGVMKCIERRCKLLGLDAPEKQEISGPDGGAIPISEVVVVRQRDAIV